MCWWILEMNNRSPRIYRLFGAHVESEIDFEHGEAESLVLVDEMGTGTARRRSGTGGGVAGRISREGLSGAGDDAPRPAESVCFNGGGRVERAVEFDM